jgi:hypothetical protein
MSSRIVSPAGVTWTLTIREGVTKEALSAVVELVKEVESSMLERGWTPYGSPHEAYVSKVQHSTNGHNGSGGHAANGHNGHPHNGSGTHNGGAPAPASRLPEGGPVIGSDGTLLCPVHETPLKQSKWGGWYCPKKDASGPNGYCTYQYDPTKTD